MRISLGLRARNSGVADTLRFVESTATTGVDGYWTVATPDYDPFVVISQAWATAHRAGAKSIATGVGVLPIADWTTQAAATAAATVSSLQGGGFRLGIGAGRVDSPAWRASRGLSEDLRPATVVTECLLALRRLLAGDEVSVGGTFVRLNGVSIETCPPPVELYVGAAGPGMLAVAGRLADGVLCGLAAPEDLDDVAARLSAARESSDLAHPVKIAVSLSVVVDAETDLAHDRLVQAASRLAIGVPGLSPRRGFPGQLARWGFGDDLEQLAGAVAEGVDWAAARGRLSPEFVRRLGIAGTPQEAAVQLAAYASRADEVNLSFPGGVDPSSLIELIRATHALACPD